MRLRVDEAAFAREVAKVTAEVQRMTPRKYAMGGVVRSGASVVISNGLAPGYEPPSASLDPPTPTWPRRFYADDATLNRLINDPTGDIHEVVREVERLCSREAGASESYRKQPDLLYPSHPWMQFVATGEAAYLGWEKP